MSEKKDPKFKLFGKMIQMGSYLNEHSSVVSIVDPSVSSAVAASTDFDDESTDSDYQNLLCSKQGKNRGDQNDTISHTMDAKQQGEPSSSTLEESKTLVSSSVNVENHETLCNDKDSSSQDHSKNEDHCDQTSSSQIQDQCPPEKPDKIIPCPRCNSMDTKFCYFNNYNVNQPRHFCKNCQRYWTAGGTMRNVPVGAGRRKNKNSMTSQLRNHHLVLPNPPNGIIHHALGSNGTVLTFGGQDSPHLEPMTSMLNIVEKSNPNCVSNGLIDPETRLPSQYGCSKNDKKDSNATLNENLISIGENEGEKVTPQNLPPQVVCFTRAPWPYTWNPIPLPSGFPMPYYSPPYLACNPPGTWNFPWLPTPTINPNQSSSSISNPNSPSLGKHARDDNEEKPREDKRSELSSRVAIPKTMRIDDPIEVAKSSIWGNLGIKNDKVGMLNVLGGGIFGGLEQSKDAHHQDHGSHISVEGSSSSYLALQANPAAFSRSLSFHENAY